jgi:hypothetical protein
VRFPSNFVFQGQGLGGALLADALERTAGAEIAAYALIVDAKHEAAAVFTAITASLCCLKRH